MSNQHALRAAKAPVGTGSAPLVAQLIALALVALGAVGVQGALADWGVIRQESWLAAAVRSLDGTRYDAPLVLVVGIVLAVVGLLLLPVVVMRRPRTSVDLDAETGVHLRTRDLARIVSDAVEGTDAVTDVDVKATRRKVKVRVTTLALKDRRDEIKDAARERVEPVLSALDSPPRLTVSVKHEVP
jgi:hypothetical protein